MPLQIDANAEKIQEFAPTGIVTITGGADFDVTPYLAIATPTNFEYYINQDSANKITRNGVLIINQDILTIQITTTTVFEVMVK